MCFPTGVPSWIDRSDRDAERFYADVLGWDIDDGVARLDGRATAGIGDPVAADGWTTYVGVDDLADALRAVDAHGGGVLEREADRALVADPCGATLVLTAGDHREVELANAPGTWNWSTLSTPDPESAEAFYGAVLGWRFSHPGFGALMIQRPGYGDVLAERDPDVRARHADPSVPAGFSDAVAWLHGGERARWTVTFAVADTDATVARAAAHGATVTSAPQTLGPARVAELLDPQGTPVTVSTYAP